MAIETENFQAEVGEWAEATFSHSTNESIVFHLRREVFELESAIAFFHPITEAEEGNDLIRRGIRSDVSVEFVRRGVASEAADCYLLLLHLCHKHGIDLEQAAREKFMIDKRRAWGEPDAEGVVSHVESPE